MPPRFSLRQQLEQHVQYLHLRQFQFQFQSLSKTQQRRFLTSRPQYKPNLQPRRPNPPRTTNSSLSSRRHQSATPPPTPPPHPKSPLNPKPTNSSPSPKSKPLSRLTRILAHLPPSLRPYAANLSSAPLSHITSFLILHELSAIIPLLSLAGVFHYFNFLPASWTDAQGKWVTEGMQRFSRFFARRGMFGFERGSETQIQTQIQTRNDTQTEGGQELHIDGTRDGEAISKQQSSAPINQTSTTATRTTNPNTRILLEVATAYAITKVFLPARIVFSVWATPWFAMSVMGRFGRIFRRGR